MSNLARHFAALLSSNALLHPCNWASALFAPSIERNLDIFATYTLHPPSRASRTIIKFHPFLDISSDNTVKLRLRDNI